MALHAEPHQLLQITITDTTVALSAQQPPQPHLPIPSLTSVSSISFNPAISSLQRCHFPSLPSAHLLFTPSAPSSLLFKALFSSFTVPNI